MPFEGLCPELIEALRARGIVEPTPPQADVIPRIRKGENILLVAPTGIGKTEAAMLPILDEIHATKGKVSGFRCIYITPLRALNRDMLRRMEDYGKALDVTVGVRHGDTSQAERSAQSRNPPEVLITTPETLQVLFTGKVLRQHLKAVQWVVVDEIHELADTERGAQMSVALERLTLIAGEFQRIGLSATVAHPDEVGSFLVGPRRRVDVRKHDTFREYDIRVESPPPLDDSRLQDRLQGDPDILGVMVRAREIIESGRSTLFFVNTRETAEWLAARYRLWDESFPIEVHHGSLSKETRMEMEDRFKSGQLKALICTSSLELGIDVGSTDMVIQYNSPRQVSRMVQRAGRAGHRVGEKIRARVLATAPDEVAEALVIARKCAARELEDLKGRPCPLSVVANQLVAMTMTGSMDRETAFRVFSSAWPFRDITRQEIEDVIAQLQSIKLLFVNDDGTFKRSRKGMDYFYGNISMIPDERTYRIRDIGTRAVIGTLDESFVATFAEEYAMFIAKGRTWRIVEMREDEILVEEAKAVGSVPNWVGSDIPVPYEVAMEVGRLRRLRNFEEYPGDARAAEVVNAYLDEQTERFRMPDDRTVTVEVGDRLAIVNGCFGSRVNETLGKIYAALLSARLGESVGLETDPYRMILELPRRVDPRDVFQTVTSVKPGTVEALSRMTILNSSFLRWRFVFVAKKFGIIDRNADHRFMNFDRLFKLHKDTPAYNEAVNKVLWEDLDIPDSEKVVSMIASGEIEIVPEKVSPIGLEGITRSKELMQPVRADHSILMALKKRLENEVLFASCLNCGAQHRFRAGDAPKRFVCEKCGGNMVAVLKDYEREAIDLVKHQELTTQEKKDRQRLSRNANLVNEFGRRAVICLAGRGIGPDTASRILSKPYVDEDEFLRSIMNAEILYAKNKRFWDRSSSERGAVQLIDDEVGRVHHEELIVHIEHSDLHLQEPRQIHLVEPLVIGKTGVPVQREIGLAEIHRRQRPEGIAVVSAHVPQRLRTFRVDESLVVLDVVARHGAREIALVVEAPDVLVRLQHRIVEVQLPPVYGIGEQTGRPPQLPPAAIALVLRIHIEHQEHVRVFVDGERQTPGTSILAEHLNDVEERILGLVLRNQPHQAVDVRTVAVHGDAPALLADGLLYHPPEEPGLGPPALGYQKHAAVGHRILLRAAASPCCAPPSAPFQ